MPVLFSGFNADVTGCRRNGVERGPRIVTISHEFGCYAASMARSWRLIFSSLGPGRRDIRLIACVTRV